MNFLTRPLRIAVSRFRRTKSEPGFQVYEPTGVRIDTVERTVVLGRGVVTLGILGPNAHDRATLRITVDGAALVRVDLDPEIHPVESPDLVPIEGQP